jgi:hypothetical protein
MGYVGKKFYITRLFLQYNFSFNIKNENANMEKKEWNMLYSEEYFFDYD